MGKIILFYFSGTINRISVRMEDNKNMLDTYRVQIRNRTMMDNWNFHSDLLCCNHQIASHICFLII